jgi:hypothetical protein
VATFGGNAFDQSPIKSGTGYIYVPRALVEDYKVATNWSAYASQFRAIEDYTTDGTVDGLFCEIAIVNFLQGVTSSNPTMTAPGSYETTLTSFDGSAFTVSVTMGGVDITSSAYDDGKINIPTVTGEVVITAKSETPIFKTIVPLNGLEEGELPKLKFNVMAGETYRIVYYLTKRSGYLYDARGCGSGYRIADFETGSIQSVDLTVSANGYIVISDYNQGSAASGALAQTASDRLYGKYVWIYKL